MKEDIKFWSYSILLTVVLILFSYLFLIWLTFIVFTILCIYSYYKIKKSLKNEKRI